MDDFTCGKNVKLAGGTKNECAQDYLEDII